jgi:hypothetical protein
MVYLDLVRESQKIDDFFGRPHRFPRAYAGPKLIKCKLCQKEHFDFEWCLKDKKPEDSNT